MTNYSIGRRYEYRSMRFLERLGYECFRSAGSKGLFDVIGLGLSDVLLVSVKRDYWPSLAEQQTLKELRVADCCKKLIHVWRPRRQVPEVKEL